jgi:hypothetical protein
MDQEPHVIRENIEETRSGLTRKIETLEQEVMGTVKDTRDAVTETVDAVKGTVENVKETITESVESVKQAFDLRRQTQRHPWAVLGGSIGVGLLLGSALPVRKTTRAMNGDTAARCFREPEYQAEVNQPQPEVEKAPPRRSFLSKMAVQFEPEIAKLRGVAIGAVAGIVRDLLKEKVPESLAPHVQGLIQDVSRKMGGEEIRGPILGENVAS